MIGRARAVTMHETGSELEALLLESRLIKQERPPFNQLLIAYVALPFVRLTLGEPFPRLVLTRELIPMAVNTSGHFHASKSLPWCSRRCSASCHCAPATPLFCQGCFRRHAKPFI